MRPFLLSFLVLPGILSACATGGKSTLLGAGIGAGAGAGIGAMVDPGPRGEGRIRNVFIGAAAGSLVGAATGYFAHDAVADGEKSAYEQGKKDGTVAPQDFNPDTGQPVLLPAKVEARFVDDQVRGNIFVPKHFEYRIVEPSRWSH